MKIHNIIIIFSVVEIGIDVLTDQLSNLACHNGPIMIKITRSNANKFCLVEYLSNLMLQIPNESNDVDIHAEENPKIFFQKI